MSYDLHITRKESWLDEEGPVITAEEWLAYVKADPQLQLVPNSTDHTAILAIRSPIRDLWLKWHEGEVRTTGADDWVIAKMILVASALNAKVQGDEGEIYAPGVYSDYMAKIAS